MITYSIYIVDDEQTIRDGVTMALEEDYQVKAFTDAETALAEIEKDPPDLVLLDILLPDIDGWVVCERLQKITNAPIVFTTALGAEKDVIRGLEMGADDYMIKPFSYKELLARVKAALHRARRIASRKMTYRSGRLFVDLDNRTVEADGEHVFLTPLEFKLLAALVREAGHVISHQELLCRVWGPQHENRRQYLKLYIWYLRQKLEEDPSNPELILTERGVGYLLVAPQKVV